MGMELGREARVLQPRLLGWLVKPVSTAAGVVSPATGGVRKPAGLPRKLGLSPEGLPSTQSTGERAGIQPSAVWTQQPAGVSSWKSTWGQSSAGAAAKAGCTDPAGSVAAESGACTAIQAWQSESARSTGAAEAESGANATI
jgi:hypothetical protein